MKVDFRSRHEDQNDIGTLMKITCNLVFKVTFNAGREGKSFEQIYNEKRKESR